MRKIIFITIVLCTAGNALAQLQPVLKNRRGIVILPQAGDYALGFGANSLINFMGNMFNGTTNNYYPGTSFATPNQNLFGKYMRSNNVAYRVYFRLGLNNSTNFTNVADKTPGAISGSLVSNVQKSRNNTVGLGFGIEKRRGNTRLQGFYGAEAFLNYNTGYDSKYSYGNTIQNEFPDSSRITINNSASSFVFGIRGFVGVEYFFAPKISIGGEFGYGPSFILRGADEITSETYHKSTDILNTAKKSTSPRSSGFSLDTDNYNGIIKVLFYF